MVMKYAQELSPHLALERALRESEARYRAAFPGRAEAMILCDWEDGRILEANEGFRRLTGCPVELAVGRRTQELGLGPGPEDRRRFLAALGAEGRVEGYLVAFRGPGGAPARPWSRPGS